MKILFTVYYGLGKGGAEVSTKILAEELKKSGDDVVFVSTEKYDGFRTHMIFGYNKLPFFIQRAYAVRFLCDVIKREGVDVVHAHDRLTAVYAILAAKKCKVPVVVNFRDYWFACPRSSCVAHDGFVYDVCSYGTILRHFAKGRVLFDIYKWRWLKSVRKILKMADAKIANSNAVLRKMIMCGILGGVVVPISRDFDGAGLMMSGSGNAGIDIGDVGEYKKTRSLGKVVVTYVGGLTDVKGVRNLMKIIDDVLRANKETSYREVSFYIVGDGPLFGELKRFVWENNYFHKVILAGQIGREEMRLVYGASDIILLPSIWEEPLSGVLLEAGIMKKAVIASRRGGNIDCVNDGVNGFLLEPFDIEMWKEKILYLAENEDVRVRMGEENFKFVNEKFDSKLVVKRFREIYSGLTGKKSGKRL